MVATAKALGKKIPPGVKVIGFREPTAAELTLERRSCHSRGSAPKLQSKAGNDRSPLRKSALCQNCRAKSSASVRFERELRAALIPRMRGKPMTLLKALSLYWRADPEAGARHWATNLVSPDGADWQKCRSRALLHVR